VTEQPIEFFVDLETQVWDALARGDADADRALLASDFVGVYPTGFADRSDHANELADGPTMASFSITGSRLIRLSAAAVMLCYRADYRPLRHGVAGVDDETMYISSLWTESEGRWTNIFSQDTPAAL
jgi:hypothetical protein